MTAFLTGKFPFLECGPRGGWAGTQRPRSGASPLRGSPDWRRYRCWSRHCGRAGGATGAPPPPAWRSRWPGVPGSLSPGKARRWRVSGGSWPCERGRDARASSRRLSGPARCTRSYSFRSSPHQGASGYLWAEERKTIRDSFTVVNIHWKKVVKRHLWTEIVSSETPHEAHYTPSSVSLQLLLSSQQQLLCSCCYALCNEHFGVCSPLADVMHSGDGVLCLCHLEVSNSSLSEMFGIYHCIVNEFNTACIDFYHMVCVDFKWCSLYMST